MFGTRVLLQRYPGGPVLTKVSQSMGHQFLDTPGFRIDLGFVRAMSSILILEHEVGKLLHLQTGKTWGYVLNWFSQRRCRHFLISSPHPRPTACSMTIFIGQDLGAPHASKSKICVKICATGHRTSQFISKAFLDRAKPGRR